MHLAYRGSVNAWECDENDHLNVRFYVDKHWQTLAGGLADLGCLQPDQMDRLNAMVDLQHLRFLRESRLAAPLSGYVAVVGSNLVLTELRDASSDVVVATSLHRVVGLALPQNGGLPEYAAPRGIADRDLPHIELSLEAAKSHQYHTIGRGVIQAAECASNGLLERQHYMSRFSDSMPHLWGAFHGSEVDVEGGAVVEYRLRYHTPLQVNDRYELVSGIYDVGNKVQRFAHMMFDLATGRVAVSAMSVGVRIDLNERRAVSLTAEKQARMRERMIRGLD